MPRTIAERADTLPALGEVFREFGYNGASLSIICKATGLGKGSLYNFFPGGKEEMVGAVLTEIDVWFEKNIFLPLTNNENSHIAISNMFNVVYSYFKAGNRVCLVGALALNDPEDHFSKIVANYFHRWIETLAVALHNIEVSEPLVVSEEIVAGIQGSIILTRATNDTEIFERFLKRMHSRLQLDTYI